MSLSAFVERCATQGHALVNSASVANLCRLTHHYAHGVVKKDTVAYFGTGVNFNTSQRAGDVRDKATQPFKAMGPTRMRHPVKNHRM
jgi:hypothetical protein